MKNLVVALALSMGVLFVAPAFADPVTETLLHQAEQGFAEAQHKLGNAYSMGGWGVPKDEAEGVKWYRKAAEQGFAEAQYRLGDIYYYYGKGVPQDEAEGLRWLWKAADQGNAKAQEFIGKL